MKRFLFALLSFIFIISFSPASFAEDGRTITILYTGQVEGKIEPCPT